MSGSYSARFIAERYSVSLFEVTATERERTVRVNAGAGVTWDVTLPKWNPPSVAILSGPRIAVWSGTRLFLLVRGKGPVQIDLQDEVASVYSVDQRLCVVCELGVLLYDAETSSIIDRYVAADVLGESWWEGDRLLVASFKGPPLTFHPSSAGLGFTGDVDARPPTGTKR